VALPLQLSSLSRDKDQSQLDRVSWLQGHNILLNYSVKSCTACPVTDCTYLKSCPAAPAIEESQEMPWFLIASHAKFAFHLDVYTVSQIKATPTIHLRAGGQGAKMQDRGLEKTGPDWLSVRDDRSHIQRIYAVIMWPRRHESRSVIQTCSRASRSYAESYRNEWMKMHLTFSAFENRLWGTA